MVLGFLYRSHRAPILPSLIQMAYRATYGSIKNAVGIPIGMTADNPGLMPRVNEAILSLWAEGEWIGHFARYKMQVVPGCYGNLYLTWPTEVETIEALEHCGQPIGVRNIYFEFIENAVGSLDRNNGQFGLGYGNGWNRWGPGRLLGDRQEVCTMTDVTPGGGKKIKAYNQLPADNGAQIIILGYDDNSQWIRTLINGAYTDGEYLTLNATTSPVTQNNFSAISGIQFSTTPRNGSVTITQVDTLNGNAETTLSTYGYNESIPIYRRSILTGFQYNWENVCCNTVTALCRLRYQPVYFDTDYVQIGNLTALKDMLISQQKRDNGKPQDAAMYLQMAIQELNDELRDYQGVAPKKVVSVQARYLWSSGPNMR